MKVKNTVADEPKDHGLTLREEDGKKAYTLDDNAGKEHTLWFRIKKYRASYILMAPFMILFLLFTVIPVVASIYISLTSFDMLSPPL